MMSNFFLLGEQSYDKNICLKVFVDRCDRKMAYVKTARGMLRNFLRNFRPGF